MTFHDPLSWTCDALYCYQFGNRVGKVRLLLQQARLAKKSERLKLLAEARYHAAAARRNYAHATAKASLSRAKDLTPEIITLPANPKLSRA